MLVALEAACADLNAATTDRLGKSCPLKIWVLADVPRWIELCCADAIGVTPCDAGTLRTEHADIR